MVFEDHDSSGNSKRSLNALSNTVLEKVINWLIQCHVNIPQFQERNDQKDSVIRRALCCKMIIENIGKTELHIFADFKNDSFDHFVCHF